MKKLWKHTKRTTEEWEHYDENDYDWDEPGDYEAEETESYEDGGYDVAEIEEEYYAEASEETEYYAEDAEEYYEEVPEETEYYAEDGGEYYEETPEEAEYYTEDGGEYYEEASEETGYYAEDAEEYYEEPPVPIRAVRTKNKFLEMELMDRVITITGIAVLLLALVTGGIYIGNRVMGDRTALTANVGSQLEGIELIGEKGLVAVADAELARQAAAELVEEEKKKEEEQQKDYDEEEYSNAVTVKLNMTSVKKDLKIKFINKKTGKLVGNVPFSVTVTQPDGKSVTWSDDDKDGIIYYKDIEAGTYKVLVNELTDERYADYSVPAGTQSVEVKKDIVYEKVDVSAEVKTEDEIDVSKEDTQINETVVESTLQDTVIWVESTEVAETYTEIPKSKIPDPMTLAMGKRFLRTAAILPAVSGGDAENVAFTAEITPAETALAIGDTVQAKAIATGATPGKTLQYSVVSNNAAVATAVVDQLGNLTVTGVAAGTATVTVTVNYAEGVSMPVTAEYKVTVMDKPVVTLEETTATVYLTEPVTINAKVVNALTETAVTAESSNTGVATVEVKDKAVTITGVATGDAVITVKYVENDQESIAVCAVKVLIHP